MPVKSLKKEGLALAAILLLIALVFATGVLDKQKVWKDMVFSGLKLENGASRDLAQGDSYGVVNAGPGFTLPAGQYRVKWMVEADGDNRLTITCDNGAIIVPGEIALSKDRVTDERTFEVKETAQNVQIQLHFESGTKLNFVDLRLYTPMYRDHAFSLAAVLLGIWLLWALNNRGVLTARRRGTLILLGFAVLLASAPALKDTVCLGHDTTFHLVRLCNLADGLAHGQFPVRLGGYSYNGYGAVTSVFYPDIFLYPSALLMNLGASMQYAVNVLFIAVNAASAAAMFAAAKRMFQDEHAALCASVLYTLSIYRISDVFTRYAFGEMLAMVFLPLFILGLWEVVFGEKRNWRVLALSASGIFMSHMLSTLICGLTAVGVCALFIVKIVKEGRLLPILKAAATAGLLCAFQLTPFLYYSMQGLGAQSLRKDPAKFGLSPAQLLLLGEGELGIDPKDGSLSTFSLEIGLPLLLSAVLVIYWIATRKDREEHAGLALLLTGAGAVFAWMATTLFPWHYVRVITMDLSLYLQFPWRMLMMTAVLLAFAGGWGYMQFAGETHAQKERAVVLVLALCALCALPTLSRETRSNDYIAFGQTVSPDLQYVEYTIPGSETKPTRDRAVYTTGDVEIAAYEKDGTTVSMHVQARTDGAIALPLFGYDGYRVTLNGEEIPWTLGDNNRLTVALEAGMQGDVHVAYKTNALFRAGDGVSFLTLLALAARACAKRRRCAA